MKHTAKRILALLLTPVLCLGLVPLSAAAAEETEEIEITSEAEEIAVVPETAGDDNDALFVGYVDGAFAPAAKPSSGMLRAARSSASSRLTGLDAVVYAKLREFIAQVAAGERASTIFTISPEEAGLADAAWTAEDLGVESLAALNPTTGRMAFTQEAKDAAYAKMRVQHAYLLKLLLAECPYELYWFDKTVGLTYTGFGLGGTTQVIRPAGSITFKFSVASEYAGAEAYTVDTSVGETVQAAADRARSIVQDHAHESDYEKLQSYRAEICDLVSYNRDAKTDGTEYGNAWQLIWVFDGDPATNVVCEGYAKAFQYLCDLTSFSDDVSSILVNGNLNSRDGGKHMWNVVTLADGNNYLVDVTNCDEGMTGYSELLFLQGSCGSVQEGYAFLGRNKTVRYYYDSSMSLVYSEDELTLAQTPHVLRQVEAQESTCTEEGHIEYWVCDLCGHMFIDEEAAEEISAEEASLAPAEHEYVPVVTAPTCTEEGYTTYTCATCGHSYTTARTSALGHSWSAWNTVEAATCTGMGLQKRTCTRCGEEETQSLPALGHDWEGRVTLQASATNAGVFTYTCKRDTSHTRTAEIPPVGVTEGWQQNSHGWWYQNADGSYPVGGWQTIEDKQYYFNEYGYMRTGWLQEGSIWYYLTPSGAAATGWYKVDNTWYYFLGGGDMVTGWRQIGGTWYYFYSSGAMATGWLKLGGTWYWFDSSGAMATGWRQIGGVWYWFESSGAMGVGWKAIGGKWYYFRTSGAMATGWIQENGTWYYLGASGAMITGWLQIGSTWYWLESSGAMAVGWRQISGIWYYFKSSGAMAAGETLNGYTFSASGAWIK